MTRKFCTPDDVAGQPISEAGFLRNCVGELRRTVGIRPIYRSHELPSFYVNRSVSWNQIACNNAANIVIMSGRTVQGAAYDCYRGGNGIAISLPATHSASDGERLFSPIPGLIVGGTPRTPARREGISEVVDPTDVTIRHAMIS